MIPCLKRRVRCVIVRANGERFEDVNACDPQQFFKDDPCPRQVIGSKSGEDYHLCNTEHAEVRAARKAAGTSHIPGVAYLYGHTFVCIDCQHALQAVNVKSFVITGEPA